MKRSVDMVASEELSRCRVVSGAKGLDSIASEIEEHWETTSIFDVSGVVADDLPAFYEQLASRLGTIRAGYAANNKGTKFSNSVDIKPTEEANHFFCATTRQPYHTDMAYVPECEAGNGLMLFCMEPSQFGGKTRAITLETLREIMEVYDPGLLEDIQTEIFWKYETPNGKVVHAKPLLAENCINWNFWQVDREENTSETLSVCERFFDFLETRIANGNIFDYSKKWIAGDALIIRDDRTLHGRDAFLGDRWLKTFIFKRPPVTEI